MVGGRSGSEGEVQGTKTGSDTMLDFILMPIGVK